MDWYVTPPFLKPSFYFAETPDTTALLQVLRVLTSKGAQFGGKGRISRGAGINARPFAGLTDVSVEEVPLTSIDEAECYATGADTRLMEVLLTAAAAASQRANEILTYTHISAEAAASDHHPVSLWTSGSLYDGPASAERNPRLVRRRRAHGRRVYARFLDLIRALRPSYASLVTLEGLMCPTDLRRDPRSLAFENFYVSARYLGTRPTEKLLQLFPDAYRERVGDGWYVSCYPYFNPEGREVPSSTASYASDAAAALIARTLR